MRNHVTFCIFDHNESIQFVSALQSYLASNAIKFNKMPVAGRPRASAHIVETGQYERTWWPQKSNYYQKSKIIIKLY